MAVYFDEVRTILNGYFAEAQVNDMLDELRRFAVSKNRLIKQNEEILKVDIEELIDCIYWGRYYSDFKYGDDFRILLPGEMNSLFKQLRGELPIERANSHGKPLAKQICITKKDAEIWLTQEPSIYSSGREFIELLKEALEQNIGAFEVPIGYPTFDEFGNLKFSTNYDDHYDDFEGVGESKFLVDYEDNYYRVSKAKSIAQPAFLLDDIAKRNGDVVTLGNKWHFALYLISIMNKYLEEYDMPAKYLFDVFTDLRSPSYDMLQLRRKVKKETFLAKVIVSSIDEDGEPCYAKTAVCVFNIEDGYDEDVDIYDDLSEPFYIIKS